ncbi:MAG TPA: carboxypeptidase-like regulatory domain-containing protein, partial [Rhodothermales bacterium]|nr:carboxypeptidase-like regulatory domain-containing protein [Rhodothermales bacterium]
MHPRIRTRLGSLLLLLALTASGAAAQTAAPHPVTVRVTDEHSGEPLPGATVVVDGLQPTVGATTSLDGLARLADVPAGAHTLVVTFVGFEEARVSVTVPLADPETPIEVAMEED